MRTNVRIASKQVYIIEKQAVNLFQGKVGLLEAVSGKFAYLMRAEAVEEVFSDYLKNLR